MHYHTLQLNTAKEAGDAVGEGQAYCALGCSFEALCSSPEALENYQISIQKLNDVRNLLHLKDEWKIGFRETCHILYTALWRILFKQGKIADALFAAHEGRAQALTDLNSIQVWCFRNSVWVTHAKRKP